MESCDILLSTKHHELEPMLMSDNTEVKIPCIPNESESSDNSASDIMGAVNGDFTEYNRLIELFRGLPGSLFVNRILSEYSSCEQSLDNMRGLLFESLKSNEDFPFDLDTYLKRRVFTRKGDQVSVKRSNDIHALISVIEGEEYSTIKDIISNSRRKSSASQRVYTDRKDVSRHHAGSLSILQHCSCSHDIALLKDTIASLQSDLLLFKQSQAVIDKLRSDEYTTVTSTVRGITEDVSKCVSQTRDDFKSISKHLAVLTEPNTESRVDSNCSRLREMNERLTSVETFLDTNGVITIEKALANGNPPSPIYASDKSEDLDTLLSSTLSGECENHDMYGNCIIPHKHVKWCNDGEISELFPLVCSVATQTDYIVTCNSSVQCSPIREKKRVRFHSDTLTGLAAKDNWSVPVKRSVTFADIIKTIGTPSKPRCNGIPVRITQRGCGDEGFTEFQKKRTKHYFVGGYKMGVTEANIVKYVTRRGPKVTMVRIFPSRRNPNYIIIRLNVEADDNSSLVETNGFWPPEVYCKPWNTNGERLRMRNNANMGPRQHKWNAHYQQRPYSDRQFNRYRDLGPYSDYYVDYNRYSNLEVDVDGPNID